MYLINIVTKWVLIVIEMFYSLEHQMPEKLSGQAPVIPWGNRWKSFRSRRGRCAGIPLHGLRGLAIPVLTGWKRLQDLWETGLNRPRP